MGLAASSGDAFTRNGELLLVNGEDSSHRPPYVTPVLMVLFDNGSVQCYSSPAHLSAVEKERTRAVGTVTSILPSMGNARQSVASAATPTPTPPARAHEGAGTAGASRATALGGAGATASLMDAAGRVSLSSPAAQGDARPPASAIVRGGGGNSGGGGGVDTNYKTSTSLSRSGSSGKRSRLSMWQPPAALSSPPPPQQQRHSPSVSSLSSSLTKLEEALAARRLRVAERGQRTSRGSSSYSGSAYVGATAAAAGRSDARSSGRISGSRGSLATAGNGGAATTAGTGGGGDSSGHDSSSEEESFVSFRSQVNLVWGWRLPR